MHPPHANRMSRAERFHKALIKVEDVRRSWVHSEEELPDERILKWLSAVETEPETRRAA
ncbi:hypothetical protein Q8F55_003246 [Vanrija albida]|uniref:Uncharacterized protein n=1 Tax=Vanrija albida TaxID=181172 RepID=A0ABR3QC59_9TREE